MLYTIEIKKYWVDVTAGKVRKRFYAWQIYPTTLQYLLTDGKETMTFDADDTLTFNEKTYPFAEIDALSELVLDAFFALPELKFS